MSVSSSLGDLCRGGGKQNMLTHAGPAGPEAISRWTQLRSNCPKRSFQTLSSLSIKGCLATIATMKERPKNSAKTFAWRKTYLVWHQSTFFGLKGNAGANESRRSRARHGEAELSRTEHLDLTRNTVDQLKTWACPLAWTMRPRCWRLRLGSMRPVSRETPTWNAEQTYSFDQGFTLFYSAFVGWCLLRGFNYCILSWLRHVPPL